MSNGLHRVCAMCEHCNEKNGCGFDDCSSRFFQHFKAKMRTDKTLLDEFAMAAMSAFHPTQGEAVDVIVLDAYNIAAAMMAERARRDEMGNVKEVSE